MKKRIIVLIMLLIVTTGFLSACNKSNENQNNATDANIEDEMDLELTNLQTPTINYSDRKLIWQIDEDSNVLDPGLYAVDDKGEILNLMFEGLVREKDGIITAGIAKSWGISDDGLTLVFNLRKSKWSDGSDLTAHDFIYSWKRGMDPATASPNSWVWEHTNIVGASQAVDGESLDDVGIRALNDYSLEIKLKEPTEYIVSFLSFYHFFPLKESIVEGNPDGAWTQNPILAVSNGPFILSTYDSEGIITLETNENYWLTE